jgi:type III secretion protein R
MKVGERRRVSRSARAARALGIAAAALFAVCASSAYAQAEPAAPLPVVTILAVGALTLLPFVFMTTTSFVKIAVVFSILKNALGAGEVPSGTVIASLAAILTLYVMAPVGSQIAREAAPAAAAIDVQNPLADLDALRAAIEAGARPLMRFLDRNAGDREQALFFDLARSAREPDQRGEVAEDDFLVLLPAFLVTELSEAFQIGFLVFLPFLIVDLVVSNVLMSLGMSSLNPTQVSMPFKLLLFVLVDGWYLLARALVLGYQ